MGMEGRGRAPNPGRHGVLVTLALARPWVGAPTVGVWAVWESPVDVVRSGCRRES